MTVIVSGGKAVGSAVGVFSTGASLAQVQNLLMDLQGQTSSNSTPSAPTPPFPNQQKIRWDAVSGATGYNIYRSTDNVTFSSYDTATVTNYTDLSATGCVNGTAGAGPSFYLPTTYWYKVSATNGASEGPKSTTQSCIYYANGVQEHTGGDFNNGATTDYTNSGGSPQGGHTLCMLMTTTAAFGEWIPWAGNLATQWNLALGAYNYFQLDVKANQTSSLQFVPIRVGDVAIQAQGGGQIQLPSTSYATLINGTWVTVKIPLADLMTDWTSGSGVQQGTWYKCGIQSTSGSTGQSFYVDNAKFTPS